jgi:hypothetical protein
MKNETIAIKAMEAYNAIYNNVLIIDGITNRVDDNGAIIELLGVEADSQIASVLNNIHSVLTANHNSGAGTYIQAGATYAVNADAYTSNSSTTPVEIARLDFSNFLDAGAVKWADISGGTNDTTFLANLRELKIQLTQFRDSVSSFIL